MLLPVGCPWLAVKLGVAWLNVQMGAAVGVFRTMDSLGWLPAGLLLQYGVPLSIVPVLMAFKYGRPRGYVRDLLAWHTKPHRYCAIERDHNLITPYIKDDVICR